MPDRLGYRAKFGLIAPGRNSVVETEMHAMAPSGVTVNTARVHRASPAAWNNDTGLKEMAQLNREGVPGAIANILECSPDYIIVGEAGFSIPKKEHDALERQYREAAGGLRVATAAASYLRALEVLRVKKVAVLTPRLPASGVVSGGLWTECGYEVVGARGLAAEKSSDIVGTPEEDLRDGIAELASTGTDAILITGTNLPAMQIADEAERWFGLHVLHINSVLMWYALRECGIPDRIEGAGRLLREN